ncbi:DUF221-domain-containing protein [Ascodesmis nigricans]|uniref:DUF221-domain-containing protein n=1 Tax=Ascodesmis nigricans TaxID=341454 RepID=A0A4S2MRM0_9PEZI|nr:DUF221-domain-containing protein [Ascodesmis nigricans]
MSTPTPTTSETTDALTSVVSSLASSLAEVSASAVSSIASSLASTTSEDPATTTTDGPSSPTSFGDVTKIGADGRAQQQEGVTIEKFLASLAVAAIVFGVQVLAFVLIRKKLRRVYEPRTYLVPERRRTPAPPSGLINWFKPIFNTATSDFISKSGLDAYFFLRYLLMLLKLFTMVSIIILPILLPLNYVGGRGGDIVQGLDRFAWTNVHAGKTKRYWAHLVLAIVVIIVFCYLYYDEMRKYIRMRQAYMTSPQHRLKASATTVLVSGIPRRWLTVQNLVELYDAFPGGIKNVWINRNYDDLQEKVEERDKLAYLLERAETELIQMAKKNHAKKLALEAKKNPQAAAARAKKEEEEDHGEEIAAGPGLSAGNPHQIPDSVRDHSPEKKRERSNTGFLKVVENVPLVGGGLGKIGTGVDTGFQKIGHGLKGGINAVTGGVKKITGEVDRVITDNDGFDRNEYAELKPLAKTGTELSWNTHNSGGQKRGSTLIGKDGRPLVMDRRQSAHGTIHEKTEDDTPTMENVDKPKSSKGSHGDHAFWHKKKKSYSDEDERPLGEASPTSPRRGTFGIIDDVEKTIFKSKPKIDYPKAYDEQYDNEDWGEPLWKKYVDPKDRPTHRLPIFKWMPFSLPLIGKKVDTITYCRREVARLNVEIEKDQEDPERYPLMNSAFIQFNQQIAAQMCCQSVSHHVPQHMSPRYIEVAPSDVIWGNMRMQWWERYLRKAGIMAATAGLVIGWAVPVAFTGLVSQVSYLVEKFKWLGWIEDLPDSVLGVVSGVLPPALLGILMAVLPMILRLFARIQGDHTGMAIEKSVQAMYFAFLFIQVFLIVSISSAITTLLQEITEEPFRAAEILAVNLPKASNFFFSYLLLQAFTVSGGAILQIATLAINFILAPILDKTAREKFKRATTLQEVKWGTFFPVYTNLACIGIVYSVISPLILIFNMITFSLFWTVYRYNLLFVVNFKVDTGGLLFPRALNQLFTGIYVMEVCLIGLFFLVRDESNTVTCASQGIIMIIVTVLTALFQLTMRQAFGPLITYIPLTLEDEAAERDIAFAKEKDLERRKKLVAGEQPGDNLNDVLSKKEQREHLPSPSSSSAIELTDLTRGRSTTPRSTTPTAALPSPPPAPRRAPELALFQDIADEIEDLTPEERDQLVARAFTHPAQRSKRPAIWIPRDELGISDDEIRRTMRFARGNVWISNEFAGLDRKGGVVFRRSPPDFDMRDIMEL